MKQFNNLTISVVFFGSSSHVLPIIEVLRKNFNLSLVVTTEQKPNLASQGETLRSYAPVISYCQKNKIPYLSVSSSSDLIHNSKFIIHDSSLGVVADFGIIIPNEILKVFPKGILNIHPSLLPKYRGPSPVQTAILNNEKTTGVSLIKLDKELDHGPILAQIEEPILENDTSQTLYERLFKIGAKLLEQNLNKYIKGELKLSEQNHAKATFTKLLMRQDGRIEISNFKFQMSNNKLQRMIRAYYPWPGVWTRLHLGGGRLSLRSHDSSEVKEKIIKFLPGNLIQVEGKKPMSYKDFLNGYPEAKDLIKTLLPI